MFKLLPLLFVFIISNLNATKIDSLKTLLLNTPQHDTTRVNTLNFIANHFDEIASDSSVYYGKFAIALAQKINYSKGLAKSYTIVGSYYNSKGEYQQALTYYIEGYKLCEKNNDKKEMSRFLNGMANVYLGIGNIAKAKEAYLKSYEVAQKDSNIFMMGVASIGLGNLNVDKNPAEALKYFEQARSSFLNNTNALYPLSVSYTSIASTQIKLKRYTEAFINFEKAIPYLKTIENSYGLASTYQLMGEAYEQTNKDNDALNYYLKAYDLFIQRTAYSDMKNVCEKISNVYKQKHDYENALKYHTLYSTYKDSVFNEANNKELLNVETKFQTEKKQQEILLLNKDNEIKQIVIDKQQTQRIGYIIGLVFLLGLAGFIFINYLQKQKANVLITQQKLEVEKQKEIVEEHQQAIVDSIHYAKLIQTSLLGNTALINKNLPQHYIYFKPKDIVSGDFYWTAEHGDKFFIAVCDCTGHGVPGAFMSLLTNGFLNEAIKEKNITLPNEVLNYVRKRLIESIGVDGQQDGMDAILLCFEKDVNTITYAAANNQPLLIRDTQLIVLAKDKMPVGKGEKTDSFTLQTVELQKNDALYLYSDGYADQFGGPRSKRFKNKTLTDLLCANSNLSMEAQLSVLETTFDNWKGDLVQLDDVCVVGIKI